MLYIKLLLILISVHELFAACPAGSIQGHHPTNCYFVYASPKNWVAAEEACQNGHLTSISDVFQNTFLQNVINSLFVNADGVWIGGNTLITPGNWTWSDNTPFNYTNWQKGQPTGNQGLCASINRADVSWSSQNCAYSRRIVTDRGFSRIIAFSQRIWNDFYLYFFKKGHGHDGQPTGNQGLCASINRADGSWSSQNCLSLNLPYICKINGTLDSSSTCATSASLTCPSCSPCTTPIYKPCPVGYLYYEETKFCYKGYNTTVTFSHAESICKNDGGSLASIHSDSESSFIGTQFGVSANTTDYNWIGLHLQNGQWTWTDGTPTDYLNWKPGEPSVIYDNCTEMYLGQLYPYYLYFSNYDCYNYYRFICKRPAL